MAMYEYQCQDCGSRFERLSWGQGSEVRCQCGSARAERIWFSRVAVATGSGNLGDTGEAGMECGGGAGEGCCGGGACGMDSDFDA